MKTLETECIREPKVSEEEYNLVEKLRGIRHDLDCEFVAGNIKIHEVRMIHGVLNGIIERITTRAFLREGDLEALKNYMGMQYDYRD